MVVQDGQQSSSQEDLFLVYMLKNWRQLSMYIFLFIIHPSSFHSTILLFPLIRPAFYSLPRTHRSWEKFVFLTLFFFFIVLRLFGLPSLAPYALLYTTSISYTPSSSSSSSCCCIERSVECGWRPSTPRGRVPYSSRAGIHSSAAPEKPLAASSSSCSPSSLPFFSSSRQQHRRAAHTQHIMYIFIYVILSPSCCIYIYIVRDVLIHSSNHIIS